MFTIRWDGKGSSFPGLPLISEPPYDELDERSAEHCLHVNHLVEHFCEEHSSDKVMIEVSGAGHPPKSGQDYTRTGQQTWFQLTVRTWESNEPFVGSAVYDPKVKRSLYVYDVSVTRQPIKDLPNREVAYKEVPNKEVWLKTPLVTPEEDGNRPLYWFVNDAYGPEVEPDTNGTRFAAAGWTLWLGETVEI